MNSVNSNIKKIRLLRNISRKVMADHLFITPKQYGNIENGRTKIDVERLIIIASKLDVKIDMLLNFDEKKILGG